MARPNFLVFLTVALTVYGIVNGYILWRGLPATAWIRPALRRLLLLLFIFAAAAYPLGRLFAGTLRLPGGDLLILLGAYYLAFMVYFLLTLILVDIYKLLRFLLRPVFQTVVRRRGNPAKPVLLTLIGIVSLIVLAGHWNARTPRIRHLTLPIPQKSGPPEGLTLVLASDLHLGRIMRNHRLEAIVALINAQNPDLVLLPGDLTDEDISFLAEQNTAAILKKIKAPLGIYAVTGNHEYYSGKEAAVGFLAGAGVRVLEDEVLELPDGLFIVGRRDRTAERFGERREPLAALLGPVSPKGTVILMDHQPFSLGEAWENGVDLQVSGHTHNGQLFPGNLIVSRIYETAWGYLRKGPTHYYVSCGVGTWGPPVRTCSVPEIVRIHLRFPGQVVTPPPANPLHRQIPGPDPRVQGGALIRH